MVLAVAVALAAGVGCGADDPGFDPAPTTRTRYEPVASGVCADLDVNAVADDIEAIAGAESSFGRAAEDAYGSDVTCRIRFQGEDHRFDEYHWEFDPLGHITISVYHDLDQFEDEQRGAFSVEHQAVENRPGTTLEEVDGWWDAGVLRTTSVVEVDGYDPSMEIRSITSVRTIRHHNLLLQVILDAYAPVGEDAVVAPLLDELTGRLVEEVGAHLTLETVTVPPEAGG